MWPGDHWQVHTGRTLFSVDDSCTGPLLPTQPGTVHSFLGTCGTGSSLGPHSKLISLSAFNCAPWYELLTDRANLKAPNRSEIGFKKTICGSAVGHEGWAQVDSS